MVDGVYDSDPKKNPNAKKYDTLSYMDVLNQNLGVMDMTAASFCKDRNIPFLVFSIEDPENIVRAVSGEKVGTLVSKLWKNTKTHGTTIISIFYFIERLESIMAEMKDVFAKAESKMNKTIDHLMEEYAAIRAGRANPAVLDHIMVNYYDTPTPINQLAAVSVTEARVLTIQPWDMSVLRALRRPSRPPTWA